MNVRDRLPRRLSYLQQERARLEEEVRQLRAAVRIWTDVCEQIAQNARCGGSFVNARVD
jgi:hypothetical protein